MYAAVARYTVVVIQLQCFSCRQPATLQSFLLLKVRSALNCSNLTAFQSHPRWICSSNRKQLLHRRHDRRTLRRRRRRVPRWLICIHQPIPLERFKPRAPQDRLPRHPNPRRRRLLHPRPSNKNHPSPHLLTQPHPQRPQHLPQPHVRYSLSGLTAFFVLGADPRVLGGLNMDVSLYWAGLTNGTDKLFILGITPAPGSAVA